MPSQVLKKTITFSVTNDLRGDQRMQRICNSLVDAGYDVILVGRDSRSVIDTGHFLFRIKRLKCFFNKGKAFYIEFQIRLFWYLLFEKSDVFGAVDLDTILPVLAAAKLKNINCSYDAHEYFTEVPEVYQRPLVRGIWKQVEKFSVPKMDACYTVSQSLAYIFEETYQVPFSVIRNIAYYRSNVEEKAQAPFILYQGALNRGRGLEQLIDAMATIPCSLKIAGTGDLNVSLRERVRQAGLSAKVEFLGFLPPKELNRVTDSAFIGYNLLENEGKSYFYSLANKTFDYLQSGIPVLCSPFPEYESLAAAHPFILFSALDPAKIAEKVQHLLSNPSEYLALKSATREAKAKLNWEAEVPKLIEIYRNLLAEEGL